jgi:hypothetical protein
VPSPSRTSDILARDTSLFFGRAYGIYAYANRPISVDNTDDITAIGNDEIVRGISVETRFGDSPVSIVNCGDIAASGGGDNFGIFATARVNSPISIENSGDIASTTSVGRAYGRFAVGRSPISVANSGDIAVATSAANPGHSTASAVGIAAATYSGIAPVSVENSGDVHAASDHALAVAIIASTDADYGPVSVVNEGDLTAISGGLGSPAYAGTALGIIAVIFGGRQSRHHREQRQYPSGRPNRLRHPGEGIWGKQPDQCHQ